MRNFQWNKARDGVWRGWLVRYPVMAEARIQPHREGFWFEVSARYRANPVRAVCGFRPSIVAARKACESPPVYGFWGSC